MNNEVNRLEVNQGVSTEVVSPSSGLIFTLMRKAFYLLLLIVLVRSFLVDSFIIDSSSMEGELLKGDYVIVNRVTYGSRGPSVLKFPFLDASSTIFRITGWKPYFSLVTLPYYRLPSFNSVSRNDIVAFNLPSQQMPSIELNPVFIKRCVGVPGDTIVSSVGEVKVNGKKVVFKNSQSLYRVIMLAALTRESTMDWSLNDYSFQVNMDNSIHERGRFAYFVYADSSTVLKIKSDRRFESITKIYDNTSYQDLDIYPHSVFVYWNKDNFGRIVVPGKGLRVVLDSISSVYYYEILNKYEACDFALRKNRLYNKANVLVSDYVFKNDYYFMLGDNLSDSYDSRNWGLVPKSHVIGKVMFVWLSKGSNGFRWGRLFSVPK